MDTPTAKKVPSGRLFPGSFRSPDMLTPWVKPVTAGKKMAKRIQKGGPASGALQFCTSWADSHLGRPPEKNEKSAAASRAITTY